MMQVRTQQGFTLIEMMVAMILGSLIVLAAGHLFLTTFKTFQQVDAMSRKQEAIVFATQTITSEIRKYHKDSASSTGNGSGSGTAGTPPPPLYEIECKYESSSCDCTIYDTRMSATGSTPDKKEPVVSFPRPEQTSQSCSNTEPLYRHAKDASGADKLSYEVTLPLEASSGKKATGNITFRVAHRDDVIDQHAAGGSAP